MRIALVLSLLLLSGCAEYLTAAGALETQAINDRQRYNDGKAAAVVAATCDISLGALARMPDGSVKCGIAAICGHQLMQCQPRIVMP